MDIVGLHSYQTGRELTVLFNSMLDMLEDFMFLRDVPYARLDGSVNRARRALDIKLFQQEKSRETFESSIMSPNTPTHSSQPTRFS
jgi:hypothetical protein